MSDPPILADTEGASAAPRKVGHQMLDLVIAGVAIAISLISLVVAVENSRIQERLLTASTWPFLQYYSSDLSSLESGVAGPRVIRLGLTNSGVGPAKVESVHMTYKGKRVVTTLQFLKDCCGARIANDHYGHGLQVSTVSPTVMLPGQSTSFLTLPVTPDGLAVWEALDRERNAVKLSICYCSVFDECGISNGQELHPRKVKSCPVDEAAFPQ